MNNKTPSNKNRKTQFEFEKTDSRSHRDVDQGKPDCDAMTDRLGIAEHLPDPSDDLQQTIRDFVVACHLNVNWYQNALTDEVSKRKMYFALSVALLLIVPIAVVFLPYGVAAIGSLDSTKGSAQDVTAQITAVLTGLLGFQRSMSAWLDKRKIVGSYAQTSAKLKEIIWSLLDKWSARHITSANEEELIADLRAGITKARDVTSAEQVFYYENLSYPTIDVGATLKSAGQDVTAIVKAHTAPMIKNLEARQKEQAAITTAQTLLAEYTAMIDAKEDRFRIAQSKNDEKTMKRLQPELVELYQKLNAAELDHAAAVSRLAALPKA